MAPERGLRVTRCRWRARRQRHLSTYQDGRAGGRRSVHCGCDGFHGPSRKAFLTGVGAAYEKVYPFGWLGILADVPPYHELIYANHDRGSRLLEGSATRSRYYIQVPLDEDLGHWPDDRGGRAGGAPRAGGGSQPHLRPGARKVDRTLRSFVFEPMRYRLLLAGDSAHIVPTGAKGLNLAASDALTPATTMRLAAIRKRRLRGSGNRTLLVATDQADASFPGKRCVRSPDAAGRPGLYRHVARGTTMPKIM